MLKRPRPELPTSCVSDLRFDALRAQELPADEQAEISAHLSTCERCRARRRALDTDSEQVRSRLVPFAVPRACPEPSQPRDRQPGRAKRTGWIGAAALAAALGIALLPRKQVERGTRAKGSPGLSFYVKRGNDVYESWPDQPIAPGDLLRFVVAPSGFSHLTILSRSTSGRVSTYFPPQGARAAPIEPNAPKYALEIATELDGVLEDERIHAVFCRTPFELAPLREELARAGAIAAAPDCEVTTLDLHKVAAP